MVTRNLWSGVAVAVQSALAAAVAVTAISKANPAVASCATPPTEGGYVLMNAAGMTEVDQRVFRVGTVVAGTSFELEGEDSTDYTDFTSGSFQTITFGTSLSTAATLSVSGGGRAKIDETTIHDRVKQEEFGVQDAIEYSMDNLWDPSDAGLQALGAASRINGKLAFRFTFLTGAKLLGYASVSATLAAAGSAQDKVTTPVVLSMKNNLTSYSS